MGLRAPRSLDGSRITLNTVGTAIIITEYIKACQQANDVD